MRVLVFSLVALIGACGRPPETPTSGVDLVRAAFGTTYRWSFDPAPHFAPSPPSPIQSTTPHTRFLAVLGKWRIERDDSAPSAPHVMRVSRADAHPSRLLVEQLGFAGVEARTMCRVHKSDEPVADASCGLVFGARSEDDYFVARIEPGAAPAPLRLMHVVGGVETELALTTTDAGLGGWTEISVRSMAGDVFVSVGGEVVLSAKIPDVGLGRVGLFARGDASFDDLVAKSLDRADQ